MATALVSLLSTASALAETGVAVSRAATISSPAFGGVYPEFNNSFALGSGFTSLDHSTADSGVSQWAIASLGVNKAYYSAFATSGTRATAAGYVRSGWVDSLTIDNAELHGQTGYFVGQIYIDVDYSFSGSDAAVTSNSFTAAVRDRVASTTNSLIYASAGFDAYSDPFGSHSLDQFRLEFTIPFTYGTPFNIAVTLESYISIRQGAYSDPGASIAHNAGGTVTWGGTVAVQDSSYQPLSPENYAMSSESGTDYLAPIPEPSTIAMLGAAAALAGGSLLRRRRH